MSILLYPPYLQWEVVSGCNHKCIHCYNYWRADNIAVDECTHFSEITQKIIERKPLYVAITGGEPLLVFQQIKPCIEQMTDAGITVSVSTNGTLITEEMAQFFEERKVDLVISLPSIDSEVCDKVCTTTGGVVGRLTKKFELIKAHHISVTVNVVITKLNLSTLYQTLEAIKKWEFVARVGIAQRPINASKEYLKFELDKNDLNQIVKLCIKAKKELNLQIDFSVCVPDCAFDNEEDYLEIEKGNCFAGTIAYAIGTNGDVKACQCDTKTYGNILSDSFEDIYGKMSEWRNGSMIPKECEECNKLYSCRGGCRVETYANKGDYHSLPTFADLKNVPVKYERAINLLQFDLKTNFYVSDSAIFLQDKMCYRVSVGIVAVHLANEFAFWLQNNKVFSFQDLLNASGVKEEELTVILNMLLQNQIILLK